MPPKRSASSAFRPPKSAAPNSTSKAKAKSKQSPARQTSSYGQAKQKARDNVASPPPSSLEDEAMNSDEESGPGENDSTLSSDTNLETSNLSDENVSPDSSTVLERTRRQPLPAARSRIPNTASETTVPTTTMRNASPSERVDQDLPPIVVPEKLLTALLHSHFQHADTKIGRGARALVGRYVETFIREAVARAVVERKGGAGAMKVGRSGGDFLEVEDLEKLAPQLILDF